MNGLIDPAASGRQRIRQFAAAGVKFVATPLMQ